MLIYILKNSWIPSKLESGIQMKSHYDDNRQFSTFRRLAINTLKTELLWFSISKCWMVSFPPAAPLTQHRSALERPWARVLGKKVISKTQGLWTMTQRQPSSSGRDSARIWYTQRRARPEPNSLPSALGWHLCRASLGSPALGRLLLWCRAWCDSLEPVGAGCWAPEQETLLGVAQQHSTEQPEQLCTPTMALG